MSIFAKKKPPRAFVGDIEGPPLLVPVDDDELIHEISSKRKTTIEFADVMEFHCKKFKDLSGATVFVDYFTITLIRQKKVLLEFHVLDIQAIDSPSPREVTIFFKDDHPEVSLKTHWSHATDNADLLIKAILGSWRYCFPFTPRTTLPFKMEPPSKWSLMDELLEEDPGPCLGYLHSYMSICYYYETEPKKEIIDHIKVLAAHNTKSLSLLEFGHATEEDLLALTHGLLHNTYFLSLTVTGRELSPELLSLLVKVLLLNTYLKEFVAPAIGFTAPSIKELQAGMEGNKSLSIASLDLSQNPLEEKGLEVLSDILGSLNYGPVQLNLSGVCPSKKGGLTAFCNALRKNTHMLVTLTTLDLSYNKFEPEHTTAFATWIASPNALVNLNLSNTRVNIDKLADALLRGSVNNLCRMDLSGNKIKSLEKLTQFVKASQALQMLDLSDNELKIDTLLDLVRNIIVNYSLLDFELNIRNIGLDPENTEALLGLLSHNIKSLDISQNQLGPTGLAYVGNGLSANTSLHTLHVNYCFQMSKKEEGLPAESFSTFLKQNLKLKTLSMKGDETSALKLEIIPVLEALTSNDTLTSLDISGHQGGDALATALGRLLQINSTLKSLEIDDNSFTIVGFQRIRDGLMRNSTLQQMTMPVFDAMSLKKKGRASAVGTLSGTQRSSSLQSVNTISLIIKDMEARLSQNYSRPKAVPTKASGLAEEGLKFKFINSARQKELDLVVQRIQATGKTLPPDQKGLIADVSGQASSLAQLQAKQEDIMKKLQADIDKKVDDFTKAVYEVVKAANEQFKEQSLAYIRQNYQGLTPDAKDSLQRIWVDSSPTLTEADIKGIVQKFKDELYSEENDKMHEILSKTSSFLYDSLATSLQGVLRENLKENIKREFSGSDIGSTGSK